MYALQQLGGGKNIVLLVKIEAQNPIKPQKFQKIVCVWIVVTKDWLVGDRAAMEIERRCGGRLGQASRLVYY